MRDWYCTPRFITRRLPRVDMDPCSNIRSTVNADVSIMLDCEGNRIRKRKGFRFGNGLLLSWIDLIIFLNFPYSDPLPWAKKVWEAKDFGVLANTDNSTKWWGELTQFPCFLFHFDDRIQFEAPPELETSQNDRPQTLIASPGFRKLCGDNFKNLGYWYKRE